MFENHGRVLKSIFILDETFTPPAGKKLTRLRSSMYKYIAKTFEIEGEKKNDLKKYDRISMQSSMDLEAAESPRVSSLWWAK